MSRPPRGEFIDVSRLNRTQLLAYQRFNSPPVDTDQRNLASNFSFPPVLDGSITWNPLYKDISVQHLTNAHIGRDSNPVALLIENNSFLPNNIDFYNT